MPIYEFRCQDCHRVFEALCRTSGADNVRCPSCESGALTRLISSFAMSKQLTPCGTRSSDASQSCALSARDGGCASCCMEQ